ncbi:hypothetical protein COCNU_07G009300 [Cocos nucifera]|uniref:Uncharacterized protein n=1 Tax=Cocos nucifera TaxID=13894 RepID=A0A8K0IFD6_COCNU|nr:hypothetical protein COCNU_07G009300 [Cocos nucifera]
MDKMGRPMNAAIGRIFNQLDALMSEGPDTSGSYDHLSQVLGPEYSGRIRCRPGHTSMSYWSETSISSQTFGVVSQEELEEALARADHAATRADRAEERAFHLKDIVRDMMSTLSVWFGVTGFEDKLARIPAPAPIFDDDDDDVDLGNF